MSELKYTPKDFKSDQEIRWCPGCGDHGIINSVQKAMAELGYPKESWAVISGIGCSSRFPYWTCCRYCFRSEECQPETEYIADLR